MTEITRIQDMRITAFARVAEVGLALGLPQPREVHARSDKVMTLYFDYPSQAEQWKSYLHITDGSVEWCGWKTYVNGVG